MTNLTESPHTVICAYAGCSEEFIPSRDKHKFHQESCRRHHHSEIYRRAKRLVLLAREMAAQPLLDQEIQ